ncbi:hypothetical protein LguiA_036298 [Lonicera macranthoides]
MEGEVPGKQDGFCRLRYRFIHQVAIGSNVSNHSFLRLLLKRNYVPRIVSKILILGEKQNACSHQPEYAAAATEVQLLPRTASGDKSRCAKADPDTP